MIIWHAVRPVCNFNPQYFEKGAILDEIFLDVYERLVQKGKKPGFLQLLVTQVVSAVWHVSNLLISF